jgi:hypothetical protein
MLLGVAAIYITTQNKRTKVVCWRNFVYGMIAPAPHGTVEVNEGWGLPQDVG